MKITDFTPNHSPENTNQFPINLLNERYAQINHGQSLQQIADAGGMTTVEIWANLYHVRIEKHQSMHPTQALAEIRKYLAAHGNNNHHALIFQKKVQFAQADLCNTQDITNQITKRVQNAYTSGMQDMATEIINRLQHEMQNAHTTAKPAIQRTIDIISEYGC